MIVIYMYYIDLICCYELENCRIYQNTGVRSIGRDLFTSNAHVNCYANVMKSIMHVNKGISDYGSIEQNLVISGYI